MKQLAKEVLQPKPMHGFYSAFSFHMAGGLFMSLPSQATRAWSVLIHGLHRTTTLVAQDLPYGLLLRDGVLEGTPLVPSARQTYVPPGVVGAEKATRVGSGDDGASVSAMGHEVWWRSWPVGPAKDHGL